MSNNRNKENSANRSGVNSGPSSQQRPSKRVAFGTSFFESESLTRLSLNDNTNDFGLRDSDDNHDDLFDLIGSMAADPMPSVNNNNNSNDNNNNNNSADRNVAAVASAADAPSAASNDDNLAENSVVASAVAAPVPNNSNANIAAAGSNNSVAVLPAVVPSAPVPNNSNANIAAAGSNNSVAVNIDPDIARYKREAREVGARLYRWNDNDNHSSPMTASLNSTSSDEPLKLIGAVTSITVYYPDGTKQNFFSMLALNRGRTKPSHFGSVEVPIPEWKRTHSGVAAPDKIFYQRQKPGERQVFSINGSVIVVPPDWVLDYCDNNILPLSIDDNWQKKHFQETVTLFMQKGKKREQLATVPAKHWCANILNVGKRQVSNGGTIRIQYMDGDVSKSADVIIVAYEEGHGEIGKVTELGSKVLPRAYLVVPENPLKKDCNTLDQKRGLSAKFRVNNVFGVMFPVEICKTITEYLFYEAGNPKKSYEK